MNLNCVGDAGRLTNRALRRLAGAGSRQLQQHTTSRSFDVFPPTFFCGISLDGSSTLPTLVMAI